MSIELRWKRSGNCKHGQPLDVGYQHTCEHWIECDWGRFPPDPVLTLNTDTGAVTVDGAAPMILVDNGFADGHYGPTDPNEKRVVDVYAENGRRFLRVDADNGSWTWELHEAHWADLVVCNVYVGRWPD